MRCRTVDRCLRPLRRFSAQRTSSGCCAVDRPAGRSALTAADRQLPDSCRTLFDLLTSYSFVRASWRLGAAGRADLGRHRHLVHRDGLGRAVCCADHRRPPLPTGATGSRVVATGRSPSASLCGADQRGASSRSAAHPVDHRVDRDAQHLLRAARSSSTGGKYIYLAARSGSAHGFSWFEFARTPTVMTVWGHAADPGAWWARSPRDLAAAQPHQYRPADLCARTATRMPRSASASVSFGLNVLVYCYMGLIAGIASLVQAQLAQSVAPDRTGRQGARCGGGRGARGCKLGGRRRARCWAPSWALALLAVLQNGLVLIGVSSYWNRRFSSGIDDPLSRCRSPPGRIEPDACAAKAIN